MTRRKEVEKSGAWGIKHLHPSTVQLKRRCFNDVVQKFIDKDIRFMMQFPARLVIQHNETERSFNDAEAAQRFLPVSTPRR